MERDIFEHRENKSRMKMTKEEKDKRRNDKFLRINSGV